MGLTRDAWDPTTNGACCDVATCNDYLDETMDNATPGIHPLYPDLLLIIATDDIPGTPDKPAHIGLPYGAYFWCSDQYSLALQIKAIRRYGVDIRRSTDDTDGNWSNLANFEQLCAYFPATSTSSIMHADPQPVRSVTTITRAPKRKSDNVSPAPQSRRKRTNVTQINRSVPTALDPSSAHDSHDITSTVSQHGHGSPTRQGIGRYLQQQQNILIIIYQCKIHQTEQTMQIIATITITTRLAPGEPN